MNFDEAKQYITEYLSDINNIKFSIKNVLILIGKYNLIEEFKLIRNNKKLIEKYNFINIFYYSMLSSVYYKNSDIYKLHDEFSIDEFEKMCKTNSYDINELKLI